MNKISKKNKTVGVFALTNDNPTLETGVTSYNIDLLSQLCIKYPEIVFYLYISQKNSNRYKELKFKNLVKITSPKITNSLFSKKSIFTSIKNLIGLKTNHKLVDFNEYELLTNNVTHSTYIYTTFGLFQTFPFFVHKRLKVPCISAIHDIRFLYEPERKKITKKIKYSISQIIFRSILNSSYRILVPSNHIKNKINNKFLCTNIEISYSIPKQEKTKHIHLSKEEENYIKSLTKVNFIFYPATIVKTKNHKTLINTLKILKPKIPNLKLILTGTNWNSKLGKEIIETAEILDVTDMVEHIGFISNDLKSMLFKKAMCLVVPSQNESFNLSIWEAYRLGCPVICSNDPELLEQVGSAAIIAKLNDSLDFSKKINFLFKNKDIEKDLIQRGIHRLNSLEKQSLLSGWDQILHNDF